MKDSKDFAVARLENVASAARAVTHTSKLMMSLTKKGLDETIKKSQELFNAATEDLSKSMGLSPDVSTATLASAAISGAAGFALLMTGMHGGIGVSVEELLGATMLPGFFAGVGGAIGGTTWFYAKKARDYASSLYERALKGDLTEAEAQALIADLQTQNKITQTLLETEQKTDRATTTT